MNYYFVYILANKKNVVLYIWVTNNLKRRIYEHKTDLIKGFTNKYKVHSLVFMRSITILNMLSSGRNKLRSGNDNGKLIWLRKKILNGKIGMIDYKAHFRFPIKEFGNDRYRKNCHSCMFLAGILINNNSFKINPKWRSHEDKVYCLDYISNSFCYQPLRPKWSLTG